MFMPIATTIGDLEDAGAAMQMSASTLVLGWPFRRVFGVGFAEIFEFARRDATDPATHEDDESDASTRADPLSRRVPR
jgi:hypothetical protein